MIENQMHQCERCGGCLIPAYHRSQYKCPWCQKVMRPYWQAKKRKKARDKT